MESDQPPNVPRVRLVQSAAASSRGRGWFFLSFILIILLGLTWLGILGNLGNGLARKGTSADGLWQETVVRDNASTNQVKVALIEADGIISSLSLSSNRRGMASSIKRQLQLAAEDENVQGVLLRIDSPGGEVLASDEICREIQRFQKETGKPVVASMSGLAASGGYYIAAPCRWIVANPLTITGSIGVILHSYNYRGLLDKVGVQPQVFKSGRFKDMLSGEKPPEEILPETRKMFQAMIDEAFARFKEVVHEGRSWAQSQNNGAGRALSEDWETYADGRILSGNQAFSFGFVDELGNFDKASERMEEILGVQGFSLIQYQRHLGLGDFLQIFGSADSNRIEVDLGFDFSQIQAGRLYFLASNYLH